MSTPYEITLMIYNVSLLPIVFFSILFIVLCFINLFMDKESNKKKFKKLKELPYISVQVPTFNDPIAARCVKKCMEFNYPKDKYEIIIVDDSTNEKTQELLSIFAKENPGFIKYIHRTNRRGFKPGALKDAMPQTKGDILVIFDADWIPGKNFLKKVVKPFADPDVAIVQTRQGFYNKDTNWITRLAAYLLMVYHTIILPINNKINCVFFCGTAGAIRRSAFDKVGGWNLDSITEDSDLSVRLFMNGYKSVYLDFETPSEVPDTFESFVKQQMRWCYGNVRVFMDNFGNIFYKSGLTFKQRIMITYLGMGNITAPIVVIMTIFGFSGWFLGDIRLFVLSDIWTLFSRFIFTAGFLFMGILALYKQNRISETKYLFASVMTVGMVLAVSNSVAFMKAIFNRPLHWHCTPKVANDDIELK